jgi:hypothetical protein
MARGGTRRYGVSPSKWVVPHEIGKHGRAFPLQNPDNSDSALLGTAVLRSQKEIEVRRARSRLDCAGIQP